MTTDYGDELVLSSPWLIHSELDMDPMHQLAEQAAGLQLNAQNASALGKDHCSWSAHEKDTGDILNQAAHRVCAETFRNISVYHPTQDHQPSSDGPKIRPDFVIAWSADGVRKKAIVADAKDYHSCLPRREYNKILRDMGQTKATRGILFFGPDTHISDALRADIEKEGKVDIVQIGNNREEAIRQAAQHIGKTIDQNFKLDDHRWVTYQPHVKCEERTRERKQNPHGSNPTYTCNNTRYHFNHPRKTDGTIDERFVANRDRNKDGGPDMRMIHNRTEQAQHEHLNQDGTDDMRAKSHREELVDTTGHHLNIDGSQDMRCKENQTAEVASSTASQEDQIDPAASETTIPTKEDGTADMRCKESKEAVAAGTIQPDQVLTDTPKNATDADDPEVAAGDVNSDDIPTKSDGSADMRFNASKEAVAAGAIQPDQPLADKSDLVSVEDTPAVAGNSSTRTQSTKKNLAEFLEDSTIGDIPTKADGTADMRFNASKDAVESGDISAGQVLDGGSAVGNDGVSSGAGDIGESSGPLKADGTPDMRFSANQ